MVKRFLTVFGLILLYMAVLALLIFVAITTVGNNTSDLLIVILAALVVSFGGFVPYLNWATRRAFTFRGEGQPVPLETLRADLKAINQFDAPVMVEERKHKLVATWKYVDARWLELFAKAGGFTQIIPDIGPLGMLLHGLQAIPSQFWAAMPFLMTVVVLAVISSRERGSGNAPACLGKPFLPSS